jgi:cell division protein ZipA
MREWLIALGIIVVVALLLDCVRRVRNSSRARLKFDANMGRARNSAASEMFEADGSVSSARVVDPRDVLLEELDEEWDETPPAFVDTDRRQVVDLSHSVPILMDDVPDARIEPCFGENDESDSTEDVLGSTITTPMDTVDEKPARKPFDTSPALGTVKPILDSATVSLGIGESEILSAPRVFDRPADKPAPRREPTVMKASKPVVKAQQEREQKLKMQQLEQQKQPQQLPLEDMIILSVMARDRNRFSGAALLETLLANGLRYGHHNIFHCYTGEHREEDSLYSLVNAVKPGTFDLQQMDTFNTPGISLFLRLPTPGNPMEAFESMLATAKSIAENLNGELRDGDRSFMTAQTIEHCRQRVRDFDMQTRLRAR